MSAKIDPRVCTGCGMCVEICPTDVLRLGVDAKAQVAYPEDCQDCFLCVFDCPVKAISLSIERLPEEPKWHPHWSKTKT